MYESDNYILQEIGRQVHRNLWLLGGWMFGQDIDYGSYSCADTDSDPDTDVEGGDGF